MGKVTGKVRVGRFDPHDKLLSLGWKYEGLVDWCMRGPDHEVPTYRRGDETLRKNCCGENYFHGRGNE